MGMFKEFRQFLLRGNVVDLAVGVVIGASFSALVAALVKDLITPLIAAVAQVPDFSGMFFTLNGSKFMYGEFINSFISFLLVAGTVFFFVIKPINLLVAKAHLDLPTDLKKCPECLSDIPAAARRCAHCGQPL
jgi:large conductance mechanosensitive channel